jgi:hypothetical protein
VIPTLNLSCPIDTIRGTGAREFSGPGVIALTGRGEQGLLDRSQLHDRQRSEEQASLKCRRKFVKRACVPRRNFRIPKGLTVRDLSATILRCEQSSRVLRGVVHVVMPNDKETYSIVVIGAMNPRIHVPGWYLHVGLIDKSEWEEANNAQSALMTPQVSQLEFKGIRITCLPGRWEIITENSQNLDRIRSLTAKVFDELLMHTPLIMTGFNFTYQRATKVENVAHHVASQLAQMPFGLKDIQRDSGEFVIRRISKDQSGLVSVGPSTDPEAASHVTISINYEYKCTIPGQFSLEDTILSRYSSDQKEAEGRASLIVKAINETTE